MWYVHDKGVITLFLYVQPGAKHTEVCGLHDGLLKIRLKAPPIEGRANEALQLFLASRFGVPSKQVKLLRGAKSRKKVFEIVGSTMAPEGLL